MKELGFPDDAVAAFKQNAITGGDVLQLGDEDLSSDLQLSRLQVWLASEHHSPTCVTSTSPHQAQSGLHVLMCNALTCFCPTHDAACEH